MPPSGTNTGPPRTPGTVGRATAVIANFLAALTLFVLLGLTGFSIYEYILLSSTPNDAGYPFGSEEAGPGYATKDVHLAHTRNWILAGAVLSAGLLYGLFKRKMALVTGIVLLMLSSCLFLLLKSTC